LKSCEALLFVLTTCMQRYIEYPGFFKKKIWNILAKAHCIV